MPLTASNTLKTSLNKLQKNTSTKGTGLEPRQNRDPIPGTIGIGTNQELGQSENAGLNSPLTMVVTAITLVNIPVPVGATSVQVEVVKNFNLIDAVGQVFAVSVQDYP